MTKILALDIDECVVSMWPLWVKWCEESFGVVVNHGFDYNLCNVFGCKAIDFWSDKDLYYNVQPRPNCVNVLEKLKSKGWQIGFVSYTKKGVIG